MDFKNQALEYFNSFSNKDLFKLKFMFDSNVQLTDWEISAKGLANVLLANEKIFEGVDSIKVTPRALYEQKNVVVAEIDILVNGEERLAVVDVLTFNDKGLISNIRAYKG